MTSLPLWPGGRVILRYDDQQGPDQLPVGTIRVDDRLLLLDAHPAALKLGRCTSTSASRVHSAVRRDHSSTRWPTASSAAANSGRHLGRAAWTAWPISDCRSATPAPTQG